MANEAPLLSVIIPSFGRDDILLRCLRAVLTQDYNPLEVIVVHQGSQPFVWKDGRVRILHRDRPVGSPQAKNLGIGAAQGDVVVFIDDDAYPQDNHWLSELVVPFQSEARLGAVGGRILSPDRPWRRVGGVGRIEWNALGMYKIIGNFDSTVTCEVDHLSSGNLAVKRSVFERLDPPFFDPAFRGGAFREEADFCLRVKAAGFTLKHVGNATVIHDAVPYGGNRRRGVLGGFWNGYGEGVLFRKHFHRDRASNVVRFLVQEAFFNWMPPAAQPFKILGSFVGASRSITRSA